ADRFGDLRLAFECQLAAGAGGRVDHFPTALRLVPDRERRPFALRHGARPLGVEAVRFEAGRHADVEALVREGFAAFADKALAVAGGADANRVGDRAAAGVTRGLSGRGPFLHRGDPTVGAVGDVAAPEPHVEVAADAVARRDRDRRLGRIDPLGAVGRLRVGEARALAGVEGDFFFGAVAEAVGRLEHQRVFADRQRAGGERFAVLDFLAVEGDRF